MNDRELLGLAAKAWVRSGMFLECPDDDDGVYVCRDCSRNGRIWNPLTDDGDALRLEVDLNVTTKIRFLEILAEENELCNGDYRKARRRAIVRAAAEIGKAMS